MWTGAVRVVSGAIVGGSRASRRRRSTARCCELETLESRRVLAFDPTGQEQETLELMNALRIDPQGHLNTLFKTTNPLASFDSESQQSMDFFGVNSANFLPSWQTLTPVAPLSWNESLYNSTRTHNLLVVQNDDQQHDFPGEPSLGDRIAAAGYSNFRAVGENLFSFSKSVYFGHSGLSIDWGVPDLGHRVNMMNPNFTEIGVSVIPQTQAGKKVGPLAVAHNFGNTFTAKTYITGAAYNDTNVDGRYTAGEGLGGVTVTVTPATGAALTATTMTAGGYRIEVPDGRYTVTFSGGGLAAPISYFNIVVSGANKKVDSTGPVGGVPAADPSNKPYFIAAVGDRLPTELKNGQLVSTLLGTVPGVSTGLALSAVDTSLGRWEYTLAANPQAGDWIAVDAAGALSEANALLLPGTARLRFLTGLKPHHTGSTASGFLPLESKLDNGLTYRSWDPAVAGVAGGRGDSTTGGAFGAQAVTAQVYFEARLFRTFNQNAQLNVYTLQAEFEVLASTPGYQDRSTDGFTGFTVFLSALPARVATAPLYRSYFSEQFNDDGTVTDMGYRYLTTSVGEATSLEGLGRFDKRGARNAAYFRELGVNNGTAAIGYIHSTAQPGFAAMSQIYRTDQFDKPRRNGATPAGTSKQEQGDHVYTTESTFEMGKTGTWRQEAARGFVRELSTPAGRAGNPAPAPSPTNAIETIAFETVAFEAVAVGSVTRTVDTYTATTASGAWSELLGLIVAADPATALLFNGSSGDGGSSDSVTSSSVSRLPSDGSMEEPVEFAALDALWAEWAFDEGMEPV